LTAHGRYGLNNNGENQSTWVTPASGAHTLTLVRDPDGTTPTDVATATLRYCGVEDVACECGSTAAVSALTVGDRSWAWGTGAGSNLALYPTDTVVSAGGGGGSAGASSRVVTLAFAVSEMMGYAGASAAAADITRLGPAFRSILEVAPAPGGFGTTPNWTSAAADDTLTTLMTRDTDPIAPGASTTLSIDVPLEQLPTVEVGRCRLTPGFHS